MTYLCLKRSDWFCYLCSCYVYIRNRIKFNDIIKNRIIKAYDQLPINYGKEFCPKIICLTCHNDLQRHLNQKKELRYSKIAIWNQPLPDHSNCFMCLFSVHKYNRIAKRQFIYAFNSSLTLPVKNPAFNDKLNNIEVLMKSNKLLNLDERKDEIILKDLLNDLLNYVVDNKTYEFNKMPKLINETNHLNLTNQSNIQLNSNHTNQTNQVRSNKRSIVDHEVAIVNEIKKIKNEPSNLQSNQKINATNQMNKNEVKIKNPIISNNVANKTQTAKEQRPNKKDLTMNHDIEVTRYHVNQVNSESLLNQEKNSHLHDLNSGIHQGSFRIEKGIDMITYFGKKYKKNRHIQKTSRAEFDDLISMLDISERSAQILETFFERKNYFVWF